MSPYLASLTVGDMQLSEKDGPGLVSGSRRVPARRPELLDGAVGPASRDDHVLRPALRAVTRSATPATSSSPAWNPSRSRPRPDRCTPSRSWSRRSAPPRRGHRPRAHPPVVRRRGRSGRLVDDLAERGLRHLRRVAVAGAHRRAHRHGVRPPPTTATPTERTARGSGRRPAVRQDRHQRGGMFLVELGRLLGQPTFDSSSPPGWTSTASVATTEQFVALAVEVVGPDKWRPGDGAGRRLVARRADPELTPCCRPRPSPTGRPPTPPDPVAATTGLTVRYGTVDPGAVEMLTRSHQGGTDRCG